MLENCINDLINIECALDRLNGLYGSKDRLCLYCKSNEWNTKKGVIHKKDCIILELRNQIKIHYTGE